VMLCLSHRAMCTVLPSLKCNSEESPFHGDSSEGDCAFFVFPGLPCDNSCDYSKNSVHMLFNLFQFADPAQRFRHEFDAITTSAVTTFFFGYFADKRQVVLNTRKDSGWRVACLVFFGNALDILANNENPVDGVANFFETHGRRF
jgi:hypothetical protein